MSIRIAILLALTAMPVVSEAQLMSQGDGSTSPTGQRPASTSVGFFELLRSGGEALIDTISPGSDSKNREEPRWDETTGPRETVMTFVDAMEDVAEGRDDQWERAQKTLPAKLTENKAAAIALLHIFDRLPEMSPSAIPSREEMEAREATLFELFPRGMDSRWAYSVLSGGPNGTITLRQTDEQQWVFSESTVSGASALLESMKSIPPRPRFEERSALFEEIVYPTFSETSMTGWLLSVGAIVGTILLIFGVVKGLSRVGRWLDDLGDILFAPLVRQLRIPLSIVLVAAGLFLATAWIHLTPALDNFHWTIVETLLILAGTWALLIVIELGIFGVQRVLTHSDDDPYTRMAIAIVRQVVRICFGLTLSIFVLQNVFQWDVTTLIGGVGIFALAISLAAKDAAANLFGALTIFMARPFLLGDWIVFKDRIGVVEDVRLQDTNIRLLTGELWSVPNMTFVDTAVENLSSRRFLRRIMKIGIRYDTPTEKVREAISIINDVLRCGDVVGGGKGDLENHPPKVSFTDFSEASLVVRADYWYMMDPEGQRPQRETERGYMSWLEHRSVVNSLLLKRLNEAGIAFAFPTQTVHLEAEAEFFNTSGHETSS